MKIIDRILGRRRVLATIERGRATIIDEAAAIVRAHPIVKVGENGTGRACSFCGAVTFGLAEACGRCGRATGIVL